jgi:hypothetical protein
MKQLTSYPHHRLRHAVLVAALAVTAAVLVGGAASSALATTFNCESRGDGKTCNSLSGPNQTMEEGEGNNYTTAEFELIFWKYEGIGEYREIYHNIFYSYVGYKCYSSVFDGHLQVYSLGSDNLAGNQIDGCRA